MDGQLTCCCLRHPQEQRWSPHCLDAQRNSIAPHQGQSEGHTFQKPPLPSQHSLLGSKLCYVFLLESLLSLPSKILFIIHSQAPVAAPL